MEHRIGIGQHCQNIRTCKGHTIFRIKCKNRFSCLLRIYTVVLVNHPTAQPSKYLSIHPSICPSDAPPDHLQLIICPSLHPFEHLTTYSTIHPSDCLAICPFIHQTIQNSSLTNTSMWVFLFFVTVACEHSLRRVPPGF